MLDKDSVRELISQSVKGVDASTLIDDTNFEDAGIDSLDHSLILLAVEEKTGKKIPDDAVDLCSSINGIIAFLDEN